MLRDPSWAAHPGLHHGFLDASDCAAAPDWAAVVRQVGASAAILIPKQVHGIDVVQAEPTVPAFADRPTADAVVAAPDTAMAGILTADCVPVLLLDATARRAAAVHAGWRGAAAGIVTATIPHVGRPQDVDAVIGPAIGPCCYAVGAEVRSAFVARVGRLTEPAWTERAGRLYVDLRDAIAIELRALGIGSVQLLGGCVACDRRYHSFRRDAEAAGRQLSFIGWAP